MAENFKKTIFIPLYSGQIARNILKTSVLRELQKKSWLRIVIFVHQKKKEFYEKELDNFNNNVVFELLPAVTLISKLDFFFYKAAFWFVDSQSIKVKNYINYRRRKENSIRYYFKRLFIKIIGNIFLFKKIFRYLDLKLIKSNYFKDFFDKYKPDLVFVPNLFDRFDLILSREAKRRKIFTMGMIRSWDNLSNRGMLRIVPDRIIVHNNYMKGELLKWAIHDEKKIFVSGMPHFDYYVGYQPNISRKDFYNKFNIPLDSEIILFSPMPESYGVRYWEVLEKLDQAISKGKIIKKVKILVRFMPGDYIVVEEFIKKHFGKGVKNIFFDAPGKRFLSKIEKIDWDFNEKDMMHLADSLFYGSIVINYASTLNIDASAFNKPIINIAYDGNDGLRPYHNGIRWLFDLDHNLQIVNSGGTKVVYSEEELIKAVNAYLKNPLIDKAGRERIIKEQCWKFDGQAGQRVAGYILGKINNN